LVKHYHTEVGSSKVDQILNEPRSNYSIARLTLTEMPSVFAKKIRTGEIGESDFDRLCLRFYADIRNRTLTPIRILNGTFDSAADLIVKHGKTRQIFTLDALQLAAALSVQQPTVVEHFVCADLRLCDIASREGLPVINPEQI
jgi:hypothetical protein